MGTSPRRSNAFAVIAILAFGLFAFAQQIGDQGWTSDDYSEVFDNGFMPYANLSSALKICGNGHYSVARLLGLPMKLYGGYWLGPVGSHWLQMILHLACAIVFYRLLQLLRFSGVVSVLAATSFVVAPWISQAVIWWATMITPAGTLCMLIGLCLYVQVLQGKQRYAVIMPVVSFLVAMGLSFYELWLFIPLLFIIVGIYTSFTSSVENKRFWKRISWSISMAWPVLATVFAWALAYKLTFFGGAREGHFNPQRALIVLFSLHARIYWWITRTPWITAFGDGVKEARWWWIVLIPGCVGLYRVLNSTQPAAEQLNLRRLLLGLFLAWGFYVSSKLVFIFSGGVAEHTRQNYGAAMGAGLGAALIYEYFAASWRAEIKSASIVFILAGLSGLAVTSAGIRHHYVETAKAERFTIEQLTPVAGAMGPDENLIVCGSGTDTQGELAYFNDDSGLWLQNWLRKVNPTLTCFVTPSFTIAGDKIVINVLRNPDPRRDQQFKIEQTRLFHWTQGKLEEVTVRPSGKL